MKPLSIYLVLLASIAFVIPASAQEIVVYEAGPVHMESAGGWVAVDKKFYGKLNVKEVEGEFGISSIQKVLGAAKAGDIAFGIDSPENVIRVHEKEGIGFIVVSIDFQNNPMRIISRNPIRSAKDIRGDFGIWPGYDTKAKCAVGKGWEKQFTLQNQSEDINPWLNGTWPLASAMTYYELIVAQREMKKMRKAFYTIDYKALGINWVDNVFLTTEEVIKKYPDIVQAVVSGRYKGFKWAFENLRETFEILKKVNERLDFSREIDAIGPTKWLMTTLETKTYGFGYIYPKKWENVSRDMFRAGLLEKMPDTKKIYSDKFPSGVLPK